MAYYNLKKKPSLTTKEGEKETMYADIVYSGTITAERLIRTVAQRTGFKEGMIEGILSELQNETLEYLSEGYRVELGEFGFFSAKVKSRLVENKNDLRSNSVSFDGVNFRASKSFRTGIRGDLERRRYRFPYFERVGQGATGTNCIAAYPEARVHHKDHLY